jgi:hypothetical protein
MYLGSREFLLSGYEIESHGKMTEGTVPVLPDRPCAERDDDVLPVRGYRIKTSHSGGGEASGGFRFFEYFLLKNCSIQI